MTNVTSTYMKLSKLFTNQYKIKLYIQTKHTNYKYPIWPFGLMRVCALHNIATFNIFVKLCAIPTNMGYIINGVPILNLDEKNQIFFTFSSNGLFRIPLAFARK